jgi:hypothetical protein
MSVTDDYRAVVDLIRGWGFQVVEWSGCYGRSNGSGWSAGVPVGHINHHYVCSLNGDQGYINGLVGNLANGSVVNWFADVHGVAYLIGTGPMNHAGTGNSSVLNLTKSDQPPPSFPAGSAGDIGGNSHYSGTECQHPGDSTPWPGPMLDVMVAINAAEALVWGWSAQRAINHAEWTNRKIDMSAGGGVNSDGWAGDELRRRVSARMSGTTTGDWFDMATKDELAAVVWEQINRPEFLETVAITIWTKGLTDDSPAGKANALLAQAAAAAQWSADGVRDLPTNVWLKPITDETANVLLARAANG